MLKINIINNYDDNNDYQKIILKVAKAIKKLEKVRGHKHINYILVSSEEIHKINKEYRHIDNPTDVISFEDGEDGNIGDIFISIERCASQALDYGHSFERELGFLSCHGFLHCLGYDHIEDKDRIVMEKRQDEIMDYIKLYR